MERLDTDTRRLLEVVTAQAMRLDALCQLIAGADGVPAVVEQVVDMEAVAELIRVSE